MIANCVGCVPIPSYIQFVVNYTAIATASRIVISARRQTGYFTLDDVSVRSFTAPSVEIIVNGGFETGNLTGWSYCNQINGTNSGGVQANSSHFTYLGVTYYPRSGSYYYLAGGLTYADYLSQTFPTAIGQEYTVSFWYEYLGNGTSSSADLFLGT
jgi:hypothetical protein